MKKITALLTLLASSVACGTFLPTDVPQAPPTDPLPTTPTLTTSAEDPMSEPFFELPSEGRLAVLGTDGDLYILERGQAPVNLTADAVVDVEAGTAERVYLHPTWSPTGWLSYVRVDGSDSPPTLDVLAAQPGASEPITLLSTEENNYIYGYWSPAECANGENCGRFAYLMGEGDGQIGFYLSEVTRSETVSTDQLRVSGSHFYSWAPDGESMLWYRNATTMSVYDVASDEIVSEFDDNLGLFQTPAWSPVDNRLLFTSGSENNARLTIADGDARNEVGEALSGLAAFDWSPDGSRIAVAAGSIFPLPAVTVVNPVGGDAVTFSDAEGVIAFFWSPDSSHVAIVTIEEASPGFEANGRLRRFASRSQQERETVLVWYVGDVATGETTRLTEFYPTSDQLYMIQFFDQYNKSHQLWSPDSRYIAFAEEIPNEDRQVISLINVQTGEVMRLGEGRSAVFSMR